MTEHPQESPPPHRPVRPPQRRQVVAAERDDPAGGLDRLGDRRHHDRPGGKADGAAAARAGAVHRHGRHRRRGALGEKRVQKTRQVFDRTDVGILVVDAGRWDEFEEGIFRELRERRIPVIVAFNKSDLAKPHAALLEELRETKTPFVETVASEGRGVLELREALIQVAPEDFLRTPAMVADLVPPGEMAVLVVPIDTGGAQGPADRAAGADDPRPAGRRRLLPGGQGAGAARRPGPA